MITLAKIQERMRSIAEANKIFVNIPSDIIDEQDSLIIKTNLEGFNKDHINVSVKSGLVNIKACKFTRNIKTRERFYRENFSTIQLSNCDFTSLKASFNDDDKVLTLKVNKRSK